MHLQSTQRRLYRILYVASLKMAIFWHEALDRRFGGGYSPHHQRKPIHPSQTVMNHINHGHSTGQGVLCTQRCGGGGRCPPLFVRRILLHAGQRTGIRTSDGPRDAARLQPACSEIKKKERSATTEGPQRRSGTRFPSNPSVPQKKPQ